MHFFAREKEGGAILLSMNINPLRGFNPLLDALKMASDFSGVKVHKVKRAAGDSQYPRRWPQIFLGNKTAAQKGTYVRFLR